MAFCALACSDLATSRACCTCIATMQVSLHLQQCSACGGLCFSQQFIGHGRLVPVRSMPIFPRWQVAKDD